MEKILFVGFLFILFGCVNTKNQSEDGEFKIEQKTYYKNPNYNSELDYKAVELGPCLHETYIDDKDIIRMEDLEIFYSLKDALYPSYYSVEEKKLNDPYYDLYEFEDGSKMPVIKDKDGIIFSFLIEEGILAYDVKSTIEEDGKQIVIYETAEILKKEN